MVLEQPLLARSWIRMIVYKIRNTITTSVAVWIYIFNGCANNNTIRWYNILCTCDDNKADKFQATRSRGQPEKCHGVVLNLWGSVEFCCIFIITSVFYTSRVISFPSASPSASLSISQQCKNPSSASHKSGYR